MEGDITNIKKELICINCPLGCNLTVDIIEGEIRGIAGNTCSKGREYAVRELTDPRRAVTSLVRVKGGERAVVPVKTTTDIPKERIMDCIRALKAVQLDAPVSRGDLILSDVCGSGADVVATADIALANS